MGLAVIAVLLIWSQLPRPLQSIPAPLVAVVGATALATMLALEVERVLLPGSLLDSLSLPDVPGDMWGGLLVGVLTVALIASVESLLSAVAVDKMGKGGKSNFDRELVGQGAANTVSGMLGGLPITGVIVRSSTNVAAGARTRASAVLHGGWVLLFTVLLIGLIELIPLAALAGLLVVIGLRLTKLAHLRSAHRQGELVIYLVTMAGVVFLNLLEGVLIGLGLSLLLVLRRVVWSEVHAQQVRPASDGEPACWRVVVEGTLSFLSVPRLTRVLAQVPAGSHVVVEMVVDFLDHAAYDHLVTWQRQHEANGGTVVVDEVGPVRRNGDDRDGPAGRVRMPALPRAFSPWSVWQVQHADHDHGGLHALFAGVREYHRRSAPEVLPHLEQLVDGQRPRALFLPALSPGCCPTSSPAAGLATCSQCAISATSCRHLGTSPTHRSLRRWSTRCTTSRCPRSWSAGIPAARQCTGCSVTGPSPGPWAGGCGGACQVWRPCAAGTRLVLRPPRRAGMRWTSSPWSMWPAR